MIAHLAITSHDAQRQLQLYRSLPVILLYVVLYSYFKILKYEINDDDRHKSDRDFLEDPKTETENQTS